MAKLLVILGPQAIGKMTIGQELVKITELKMFHNHILVALFEDNEGTAYSSNWKSILRND